MAEPSPLHSKAMGHRNYTVPLAYPHVLNVSICHSRNCS